jgi:hypothetical protein
MMRRATPSSCSVKRLSLSCHSRWSNSEVPRVSVASSDGRSSLLGRYDGIGGAADWFSR